MSSTKNLEYQKTAFLSKSNSDLIEEMYMQFVKSNPTLPDSWRKYFNDIGYEMDIMVNEITGHACRQTKKIYVNK